MERLLHTIRCAFRGSTAQQALHLSKADVRALLVGGELKGQLRASRSFRERQICFREASADEARPEQKKALNADQPY